MENGWISNKLNLLLLNVHIILAIYNVFILFFICTGINPRCLDQGTVESIIIEKFDGVNWEASFELEKSKPVSIQSRSK